MRPRTRALIAVGLALTLGGRAAAARAEDETHGRLGLTLRFSDNDEIGLQVCPRPALCLRPKLSYTWLKSDNAPVLAELSTDYPVYETTERYIGGGLDVLWRVPRPGPLVPYLGLGFGTRRADVPYADLDGDQVVVNTGALTRFSLGAMVGFEYRVHRRFALYGEAGLAVTRSERFGFGGRRLKTTAWGTASSGVGVVFYLK